jgi:cytochrome P450
MASLEWVFRPHEMLERCHQRYGDAFTVWLPGFGTAACFAAPDAVRQVFTARPDQFNAGAAAAVLEPVLGTSSIVLLDGAAHQRQRRVLLPPFQGDRMRAYTELMRDAAVAAIARLPRGHAAPIHPLFQEITMTVILRAVFGVDDPAQLARLAACCRELLRIAAVPLLFLVRPLQVDLGPRSPWGRFRALRRELDALVLDQVARRRAAADDAAPAGDDVLSLLLRATHEDGGSLSDAELRDELFTMLAAGFDTTATALAWAVGCLVTHREALDRVRAEVDAELDGAPVESTHLSRLVYLDATIKETLRLHPAVPLLARRLTEPMEVGGYALPAGVSAAPCLYLVHRRPDIYPEPHRFRPERFVGVEPDPYAFVPFGRGVRRCIGMAFALHEMKVILATLCQHADLRPAPTTTMRSRRFGPITIPADGMPVIATTRDGARARPAPATTAADVDHH